MTEEKRIASSTRYVRPQLQKRDMILRIQQVLPKLDELKKDISTIRKKQKELFNFPVRFDPKMLFIHRIDQDLLQVLVISLGGRYSVAMAKRIGKMSELQRRKLFEKCKEEIEKREWSYEELRSLFVALKFPKPKRSRFKRDVHAAVRQLVKRLEQSMHE